MNGNLEFSENELHAFIDGALDAGRFREIEAIIEADPALAERVAGYRSDKEMLKRVNAPLIDRPIPSEWLALAHSSRAPARPAISWRLVGSMAAAVVLAVMGAVGIWQLRQPNTGEVVQAALDARGSVARAEKVIAIKDGANVGRYDTVLSAAVASNVKIPDLRRLGYELTGIRLYPGSPGGGAVELLYRGNNDRLFTLYVRRSNGTVRFDQFERNGLRVCVWQDEVLSTVMAGNVSTAAMQRLASLTYSGLTL